MGYELSIDDRHRIVEIRFSEKTEHSEHLKARDEILEICRIRNIHKILVDARELVIDLRPSVMELFDFGVSWAEKARGMSNLLAGVLPRDSTTRENVRFGDTVASNRGFVSRAFDDIEEAKAWLRGDEE